MQWNYLYQVVGLEMDSSKRRQVATSSSATPSVSVIVALFNASEYLEECLDSILSQTYSGAIEVSIYDDASTDNSRAVLDAWVTRTAKDQSSSLPPSSLRHAPFVITHFFQESQRSSSPNRVVSLSFESTQYPARFLY